MPTSPMRRMLLLTVPLILALTACQNRAIADPDLMEAQAPGYESAGPIPYGVLTDHPCPNIFEPPCADGTGCDPSNNEYFLDVPASLTFTWSYDCNPDGYAFSLGKLGIGSGGLYQTNVTTYDSSHHGPARELELPADVVLEPATHYVWYIAAFQSDIFPSESHQIRANYFWTGPLCTPEQIVAPIPEIPYTNQVIHIEDTSSRLKFAWSYLPDGCIPTTFEAEVADDEAFTTDVVLIEHDPLLATAGISDLPLERCHTYYWHVRGTLGEGGAGPWSAPIRFYVTPPGGLLSCMRVAVVARARLAASCRVGPGTFYARAAYVAPGEEHPVDGRSADGLWFHLQDLRCYMSAELGELEPKKPFPGGPPMEEALSVLPDPPTPTPPPPAEQGRPACSETINNGPACVAAGGTWKQVYTGGQWICDCP